MEKTISLLGIREQAMLCRIKGIKGYEQIIMEAITEEQENKIDKAYKYYGEHKYITKEGTVITGKNIFLYGEVNLDSDDDIDVIERFPIVSEEMDNFIYSNFDYDKGTYTTIDEKPKGHFTCDRLKWFMYNHCLIGKPKRIIIYKINKTLR